MSFSQLEMEQARRIEALQAEVVLLNTIRVQLSTDSQAHLDRAEKAEAENADMKSRWMDWCDSHALDRIEALQAAAIRCRGSRRCPALRVYGLT